MQEAGIIQRDLKVLILEAGRQFKRVFRERLVRSGIKY